MHSIFDAEVTDAHQRMYQGWVFPDIFNGEPQPVLKNWHPEDLVAFCGGEYVKLSYSN
jgi:hypothetical protein